MLEKFKEAMEAGKTAVAEASGDVELSEKPVIALMVLDAIGPTAEDLRRRHLAAAGAEGARALFILGPKSEHEHPGLDLLCEYIPLPEDLSRATGERADGVRKYINARVRLILDKWTVRECRWIGETAAELVDDLADPEDKTRRHIAFLPAR